MKAAIPTGRLIRKTHRQLAATSRPPTTGPTAADMPPTAVQARTAPCRRSGGVGGEDQPEGGRGQQGRPGRLHEAEADEHPDAGGGGTRGRSRGEDRHAEEKGAVAPVTVGEASEEDQQRRVDDRVPVEDPGQLAQVRGPQVPGDLRQGHVDDEEVEAGQDHSGASDDEHLAGGCLGLDGGGSGTLEHVSEFRHKTHS